MYQCSRAVGLLVAAYLLFGCAISSADRGTPWSRHTIDDSSRGADGVRLADVNGDGLQDIVTGWEEGGRIRVYLNPGHEKSKAKWPAVTVGKVGSPEDAVFVDLDDDGATDVVSCCEGNVKTVWVHWAPENLEHYMDSSKWRTEAIPSLEGAASWMFCLPLQVDNRHGNDLVLAAKGTGAQIGWLQCPEQPRRLSDWKWHPLYEAGWIMSLVAYDMDEDGDPDIVASDRKGENRGCLWLENPGADMVRSTPWKERRIGPGNKEVMFLDLVDLDRDSLMDVLVAVRGDKLIYMHHTGDHPPGWQDFAIELPGGTGTGKAVRAGDVDLDGKIDIVFSCEHARGKSGVMWMEYRKSIADREWNAHEIGGPIGTKYDLVELIDLDGDGDPDVLTCEESENLGVIWYENPTK